MTKRWGDLDAANSELSSSFHEDIMEGTVTTYPVSVAVKGNNIGTLSYKWNATLYYRGANWQGNAVLEENLFNDVTGNTLTKDAITEAMQGQPHTEAVGTCTITNTFKGATSSITVDFNIENP